MYMSIEFWSCDLWPWHYNLDFAILENTAVSSVLIPMWPIGACEPPMGVDVHRHGTLVVWPLILELWLWPWDSCDHCCIHGIDASLYSWTTGECQMYMPYMCMEIWSCDLGHWTLELWLWPWDSVFLMVMDPPVMGPHWLGQFSS